MTHAEPFHIRGVIEGFYGRPWSHQERLDMLAFMHRHGFNVYAYTPKDDPYLRERWQEDHPADELSRLEELVRACHRYGIRFLYCVSPGLNIEYGNPAHLTRLMEKYRTLFHRGVRHFGLLFDDIPEELLDEADRARFRDLAEAHARTARYVWEELQRWDADTWLIVCPTQYHGLGYEPYITRLTAQLPAEVELFWTGRFVCSPYLTEGDAARFVEWTGRKPVYWDNYPVNDLGMSDELHIGPLMNRDPGLYRYAYGYMANAMELAESSKIALITIAEYLRDPERYDPESAWPRAVAEVAGEDHAEPFLAFADNVRSSFLSDRESPRLTEALRAFRYRFFHGNPEEAVARLKAWFAQMERTADQLVERLPNRRLAREIAPWVAKYRMWAKVGESAVSLIDEGRRGRVPQAVYQLVRLKQRLKAVERMPQRVSGHVMKFFATAVLAEVEKNRPGRT